MKLLEVVKKERPTEIFSTMGCRTANGFDVNFLDIYKKNIKSVIENGKLADEYYLSGAQKDGRGNICPVTVILPKIAVESIKYLCKKIENENQKLILSSFCGNYGELQTDVIEAFMKLLEQKINEAKDMLIERYKHICSQPSNSARFMYENNTMYGYVSEEGIQSAIKHGTLAIGQIALAETLQILIGCNQTKPEGLELAKRIEELFQQKCNEFKENYKLNFGVYYTPAENLCYTAYTKFVGEYGHINGVTNYWQEEYIDDNGITVKAHWEPRNYFTNSIHVPVWENIDAYEKMDIESQLTGYSSAGCITYIEFPSTAINNIDSVEDVVIYAMDHDIPYFGVNFPLDRCSECGASGDFNGTCPECGSHEIEELRRVTGYLATTKKYFNRGKQEETDDRVKHFSH